MSTISKHRPASSPYGDFVCACDYCGIQWLRSKCRRDASGLLACPDDQAGRDVVTLNKGNADYASRQRRFGRAKREGANWNPPAPGDGVAPFVPPNGGPGPDRGF